MPATPGAVLILVCPTCGKKFRGNPEKPDARYECPDDKNVLVKDVPRPVVAMEPPQPSPGSQDTPPPPDFGGFTPPPTPDAATMFAGSEEQYSGPADGATTQTSGAHDTVASGSDTVSASPETQPFSPAPEVREHESDAPRLTDEGTFLGFEDRRSVVAVMEAALHPDSAETITLLGGRYETVAKLGQGGGGQVIKVLDRDLRREVAMKMLLPAHKQGGVPEDVLLRFVKEAQATGQLEHPNIVPVHDLAVDGNGHIYFTLKYAQGDSLKDVIRGRRDNLQNPEKRHYREMFDALQMVDVLIGICQGVAYAHSKGIIHRDLKPENVMLGHFGEVLVMDWGLAKALGKTQLPMEQTETVADLNTSPMADANMTMEGSVAGTPAYMSPEQANGKISELNEKTDIYSLGAILYEILSGHPPYAGTTAIEVVKKVLAGPPESLSSGTHGFKPIPRELKAICDKAMQREPKNRYRSVEAMRDDLQNYLSHRPVSSCPDTLAQRTVKFLRRNRHLVTTSATSAAAVLLLVLGGWWGVTAWRTHSHLKKAEYWLQQARDAKAVAPVKVGPNDPYREQMEALARGDLARAKRADIQKAMDELILVLDAAPKNSAARRLMADGYMEQWRLALGENNTELMRATRAQVEQYAPSPSKYTAELDGLGTVDVMIDPADAEVYLYSFQSLHPVDKQGNSLPVRLIPVPVDSSTYKPDDKFMQEEMERAKTDLGFFETTHSIFRLEPRTAARVGGGRVQLKDLPPGSYLLLMIAPGRGPVRFPFNLERGGAVQENVMMPKVPDMPPGFFFIPGGSAWVGGDSANAVSRRMVRVKPFFMYHDEISMGDYAEFLKAQGGAAKSRLPRDFGKPLATLGAGGALLPADGSDAAKFLLSPVRGISYNDVMAYIDWRSQRDRLPYRLPNEWEWESTCRGADGRRYSWGDYPGKGLAVVTQGYGDTGSNISWKWQDYKDESPAGVHNLAGGVAEWTSSQYDPKAAATDPVYGQHAIRGNAWSLPPTGLECSFRTSGQPDYFHPTIGFRLALDYPVQTIGDISLQAAIQDMKDRAAAASADHSAH
jgi:eukaryotic-like serine/threonine-protein kinase